MREESLKESVKRAAVIVAAGKGRRMGGDVPKQYLQLAGKQVLCYSVETFLKAGAAPVVIVVPAGDEEYVRDEVLSSINSEQKKDVVIVPGGAERHDSVYLGLQAAGVCDYVWIHDAARPLVGLPTIERAMAAAEKYGATVPVVPVKDTIYVAAASSEAADSMDVVSSVPDRSSLRAVQTPQTFSFPLIMEAHEKLRSQGSDTAVTDDAMLVKIILGKQVVLSEGSEQNFKITTPEDIARAEGIIDHR